MLPGADRPTAEPNSRCVRRPSGTGSGTVSGVTVLAARFARAAPRCARTPSTVSTTSATQTRQKPMYSANGTYSCRTRRRRRTAAPAPGTAAARARSSGSRRVAAANSSNGTAVTTPVDAISGALPAPWWPNARSPRGEDDQRDDRGHEHHAGLDGQRLRRRDGRLLLAESVQRERKGEGQRDPRQPAVVDGDDDDGDPDRDRDPLGRPQSFAEHHDAEQDRDQRVDEVAEAGLDHVAGVDALDVDAPVDRDQHGGQRRAGRAAPVAQHLAGPP